MRNISNKNEDEFSSRIDIHNKYKVITKPIKENTPQLKYINIIHQIFFFFLHNVLLISVQNHETTIPNNHTSKRRITHTTTLLQKETSSNDSIKRRNKTTRHHFNEGNQGNYSNPNTLESNQALKYDVLGVLEKPVRKG